MSDYNSSLPIRTESAGDAIVKVADATIPSQQLAVNADGSVNITDNGGAITVDASNLDIRDLSAASDSVEAVQDTHDDLNANANLQVGNADVANGNPVPISDAGGAITVDAIDLDIRDLDSASDSVTVVATDLDIRDLSSASDSVTVVATDLDIRNLSAAQDNVAANIRDESGAAFSASNPLPVSVVDSEGTEVNNYNTAASVAAGGTSNHDYTTPSAFKLRKIWAAASGKLKIEVQIETAAASGTFNTVYVGFNSTAHPTIDIHLSDAITVASGARVRTIRTNADNQAQDVYSTVSGFLP